jgi:DNA-binding NarL/FixJ family response regulator
MSLRILLADDHEIARRGLRALLEAEAGWQVAAEAANGREAVALARELRPDVAILDIGMPELNGLEAARRIRGAAPRTEVLILTLYDCERVIREALTAGARGYVLKSDAGRDLVRAVAALARHQPFFTARVAELLLEAFLSGAASGGELPPSRLTPREREILQLLSEGRSNRQIAERLGIRAKTVAAHRANLMRRLDLHSLSELVRYAVRNRVVQP